MIFLEKKYIFRTQGLGRYLLKSDTLKNNIHIKYVEM